MNTAIKWGAVLVLAGSLAAQTAPTKKHRKVAKPVEPPVTQQDVQSLKDSVALQQQQIEVLKQELQKRDQAWQDTQQKLQAAQSESADAKAKATALEASDAQAQDSVSKLSGDLSDMKSALTNSALTMLDDQKRMTAFETTLARFKFAGDIRVRGESFNQQGTADRNRARVRARFGVEGKFADFTGGFALATGTLGDPTTTNETLTNNFARKTIALDRAYVTYNPERFKALQLTGGKFAYTWIRTGMTFDPDINPDGFSAKLSYDLHGPMIKNVTIGTYALILNEANGKGNTADSYALGVHANAKLTPFGDWWTAVASFSATKWNKPNSILNSSAFAVGAANASFLVNIPNIPTPPATTQLIPTLFTINLPGEGPGCQNPSITLSTIANPVDLSTKTVPASPNCVFAPNGMTNAIIFTRTVDPVFGNVKITNQHFASGFFYADFILNNTFKTPFKRLPLNVNLEFEDNLDAVAHPYGTTFDPITNQLVQLTNLGSQGKAYGFDVSLGQTKNKGDFQVGYAYLRQEQDSAIASFVESDQRAPTNILQHRFYALYRMNPNTVASFTFWRGRTLNTALENAVLIPGLEKAGALGHSLNRLQFDFIYTF